MRHRLFAFIGAVAVAGVFASAPAAGQGKAASTPQAKAQNNAKVWRTAWGDPDLQGSWTNATTTPLQRPARYGDRKLLTAEEVKELDAQTDIGTDRRPADPVRDVGDAYNRFWWDRGYSDGRTSLIIDPENGRIPPMTLEGQKRIAAQRAFEGQTAEFGDSGGKADTWEDRSLYERCIIRAPLPRISTGYDNNYQIVQAPGYVAILQEQMHETRVIPLDGRPHLDGSVRQWLGDSRGHWEGNTLVVETTNFTDQASFQGATANMRLVERWTRVADNRIDYLFTVEDPATWTHPWTAAVAWNPVGPLFEYACHEGNYGLYGILEGARQKEKDAAEAARKGTSK
jgi:hypothetical protein